MAQRYIGLMAIVDHVKEIPGIGIELVDLFPPRFCFILPKGCPEFLNSKTWEFSRIMLIISEDCDSGVTSKAPLVHLKRMGMLSDPVTDSPMELD
jgi:hypothetical protein